MTTCKLSCGDIINMVMAVASLITAVATIIVLCKQYYDHRKECQPNFVFSNKELNKTFIQCFSGQIRRIEKIEASSLINIIAVHHKTQDVYDFFLPITFYQKPQITGRIEGDVAFVEWDKRCEVRLSIYTKILEGALNKEEGYTHTLERLSLFHIRYKDIAEHTHNKYYCNGQSLTRKEYFKYIKSKNRGAHSTNCGDSNCGPIVCEYQQKRSKR